MTESYASLLSFAGKVAVITGGSHGIGQGCARVFVGAGAAVVIGDRDEEAGVALAKELTAAGPGRCDFVRCEMTRPEEIGALIGAAERRHSRLDCLINNVGAHPDHRQIDAFSIEEFEALFRLNVISAFAGCKYGLPLLRQSQGSIVIMSSLVARIGQEWATTYVATKGALSAFARALAVDEARHGVRVNAILPGVVATPAYEQTIAGHEHPEAIRDHLESWQWLGRPGTPEEIGCACLFLASPAARFITGVELILSGGAELGYGVKWPKQGGLHL
jgi:NAD(P)-dependent dehydrogenase (short-subunit alcohol dehydrogenase family)